MIEEGDFGLKHCVIVASMPVCPSLLSRYANADYIIAADAGYCNLQRAGIVPSLIVGDFDSAPYPQTDTALLLPKEKDDTDTYYAARKALAWGADKVTLLGATGGRLDHTIANLHTLLFLETNGAETWIVDETTEIRALLPGTYTFSRREGFVSLFPLGEEAEGVTLQGMKYPLQNATLRNNFPVGVSNEFAEEQGTISVKKGGLYLFFTHSE